VGLRPDVQICGLARGVPAGEQAGHAGNDRSGRVDTGPPEARYARSAVSQLPRAEEMGELPGKIGSFGREGRKRCSHSGGFREHWLVQAGLPASWRPHAGTLLNLSGAPADEPRNETVRLAGRGVPLEAPSSRIVPLAGRSRFILRTGAGSEGTAGGVAELHDEPRQATGIERKLRRRIRREVIRRGVGHRAGADGGAAAADEFLHRHAARQRYFVPVATHVQLEGCRAGRVQPGRLIPGRRPTAGTCRVGTDCEGEIAPGVSPPTGRTAEIPKKIPAAQKQ
jgi:hypothetical protein